jgi:choline-sulfatase
LALDISAENVRRSRRAYFANISYIDEKIGEILDALEAGRMDKDTIIVFLSDHGDMLGERGMWFKMSFYEGSARVPLMIAAPGLTSGLFEQPVSTLDVLPTLAALAGIDISPFASWIDGQSLVNIANGKADRDPVFMEYAAEASIAPLVGVRDGQYKLVLCPADPPQLFDLAVDPLEATNFATDPAYAEVFAKLEALALQRWDIARFDADIRTSQARRHVVYDALRSGAYYPWDFQPLKKASERYMRNHMDLNILESSKRYPRGE